MVRGEVIPASDKDSSEADPYLWQNPQQMLLLMAESIPDIAARVHPVLPFTTRLLTHHDLYSVILPLSSFWVHGRKLDMDHEAAAPPAAPCRIHGHRRRRCVLTSTTH